MDEKIKSSNTNIEYKLIILWKKNCGKEMEIKRHFLNKKNDNKKLMFELYFGLPLFISCCVVILRIVVDYYCLLVESLLSFLIRSVATTIITSKNLSGICFCIYCSRISFMVNIIRFPGQYFLFLMRIFQFTI